MSIKVNGVNSETTNSIADTETDEEEQDVSSTEETEESSTTAESGDDIPYSIVDIENAPDDYGSMKDVLNKCIDAFDGMTKFVLDLLSKDKDLTSQIGQLNGEVDTISTDDGTGSGKNSAYSLDLPGDEQVTTNDPAAPAATAENDTTDKTAEITNTAATKQITEKADAAEELKKEVDSDSDSLNQVSQDLGTTGNSVSKIMDKVGAPTEKLGTGDTIMNALTDPKKPFRGFNLMEAAFSIFGSKKKSGKDQVIELGKEAFSHSEKTQQAVAMAGEAIKSTSSTLKDAESNLEDKQGELDRANKSVEDGSEAADETPETSDAAQSTPIDTTTVPDEAKKYKK